ncbi:MAG TPA: hypothetical protein VMG10_27885, partial [Gemmataceae bacterium]|nr:hypothetical protein [Gemmataceae bacterium]
MKSAGFLDRLDDLLNPIVVKELRQAVKSRIVMAALILFLLLQLAILLLSLSFDERRGVEPTTLHAGRQIFLVLQGILLGTCMLLVPAYAGIRLAAEHSDTNVDLLFISTLRPFGIIAGKLQASIVLILLIFSACAPFMTFTYLLRGIDIPSIILVLALDFLVVLVGTQGAIFLGAVPANVGLKLLLGLVGLGALGTLFGNAMAASIEMLDLGLGSRLDTPAFWLVVGAVVVVIVAVIGLLFSWSVAIVSPPSSNRALPVRLYLLAFWLVTGGAATLLTHLLMSYFHFPLPLLLWMDSLTALLCALILTAINERDHWGLRVKRTIPRRWWLHGPLFLLYSGSAGGILFLVLLIVLTITLPSLALAYWSDLFVSRLGSLSLEVNYRNTLSMVMIALYAFDYCMTAVWLRNVLLSRQIKATYTWALALVLWGLGFALPYPLLFVFNNEELRMGQVNPWWQISNPFSTIYTCVWERGVEAADFRDPCLVFLSVWGLLVSLGCLPWMIRQMKRFRPPDPAS